MKRQRSPALRSRAAIVERLKPRTMASGNLSGPCLPALLDHYVEKLTNLFAIIDRPLTDERRSSLRAVLSQNLEQGFSVTPHARLSVTYRPLETSPPAVHCDLEVGAPSPEELHQEWLEVVGQGALETSEPPDAKVKTLARELAQGRPRLRVLDIGAGTGRNALAVARLGLRVDALEPVAALARELERVATRDALPIRVLERGLLDATELPQSRYDLVILARVAPQLSPRELESALGKLSATLAPEGQLLIDTFVGQNGFRPDALATQVAQSVFCTFFSRSELLELFRRHRLDLVSDEPAAEYERLHSEPEAPRGWYIRWANGELVFTGNGATPIALHWMVLRRDPRPG